MHLNLTYLCGATQIYCKLIVVKKKHVLHVDSCQREKDVNFFFLSDCFVISTVWGIEFGSEFSKYQLINLQHIFRFSFRIHHGDGETATGCDLINALKSSK